MTIHIRKEDKEEDWIKFENKSLLLKQNLFLN